MASYLFNPVQFLLDANGNPVSGGKIYVYDAGTTDLTDLFSDSALTVVSANPIITSSSGRYIAPFLADGEYKIVIMDSNNATLSYPAVDNFSTFITSQGGALAISLGGTGATTAETARSNLGAASASDVSTLSAAVTSVADEIAGIPGGALGDVAALDSITPTDLGTGFKDVCIQRGAVASTSVTTVNSTVSSATTPTNANGTQLLSLAFTPTRTDSELEFRATIHIKSANILQGLFYLCRSDSTNAISISFIRSDSSSIYASVDLYHRFALGADTAITYSIRAANSDGGDSFTMNTSDFGGISKSSLTIRELIDTPIS